MKILVTGVSGMLGSALSNRLSSQYEVFSTGKTNFNEAPSKYKIFNLNTENYKELILWSKPDLIIHCAALTNGNYCDLNPNEAFVINGISVKKLLDATDKNVRIIYISTDAVFSSNLHLAKETDCVSPENVYGKSKEIGEFFLRQSNREYCIIRTTIVGLNMNSGKTGFVDWLLNSSKRSDEISLFDDVIFNPISIWDLSKEIEYLMSLKELPSKTLHISGKEVVTKHQFGIALLKKLELSSSKVNKGSIKMFKDRSKRCMDQSMDCNYYQKEFKRLLPDLKKTVKSIYQKYHESN